MFYVMNTIMSNWAITDGYPILQVAFQLMISRLKILGNQPITTARNSINKWTLREIHLQTNTRPSSRKWFHTFQSGLHTDCFCLPWCYFHWTLSVLVAGCRITLTETLRPLHHHRGAVPLHPLHYLSIQWSTLHGGSIGWGNCQPWIRSVLQRLPPTPCIRNGLCRFQRFCAISQPQQEGHDQSCGMLLVQQKHCRLQVEFTSPIHVWWIFILLPKLWRQWTPLIPVTLAL